MSCCPPDSTPYLKPEYSYKGHDITTPEGFTYYTTGTGDSTTSGLILMPDVWGYHSGRTRSIADYFADSGMTVLVPKAAQPALRGGVDGDGLPDDFDIGSSEFMPWVQTVTWESLQVKIKGAIDYLHNKGITKIAMIGFCWGGWVTVKSIIAFPGVISVAVSPHPAIHLEQYAWSGSIPDLAAQVKIPFFVLPAGNDPDIYREGGAVIAAFKANNPKSATTEEFKSMAHGFVPRGDITQPEVAEKVKRALEVILEFIQANIA